MALTRFHASHPTFAKTAQKNCAFLKDRPDARVSLDIRARRDAGKWLAGREYDIGIGALPVDHPDIDTEVLIRSRAQAVIPVTHPLSGKKEIVAEDLAEQPLIALMHGLLLRNQVDDLFSSTGLTPRYLCDVASSEIACQLVENGVGITIADSLTGNIRASAQTVLRPIRPERWMSFGLFLPRATGLSKNGQKLLSCFRDTAREFAKTDPYSET